MEKIKGEYWIIAGTAGFADGDIGDTNHSGYALDYLRCQILDSLGLKTDGYNWEEQGDEILMGIAETPEDTDACEVLIRKAAELGLAKDDILHAFERDHADTVGSEDIREYMSRVHGWIVCQKNRFCTWFLTRDAVEKISEAVGDILDQEGSLWDDDVDAELEIYVASTGRTYEVLWQDLERGDMSALQLTEPVPGPNAQVAAMDKALEHPYYAGKHT